MKVLDKSENFKFSDDAIYAKKLRGDQFNSPSLKQSTENFFGLAMDEYENILPMIDNMEDREKRDILKKY